MRPLLKPGLRRVSRDGGTLQIGLTPGRSLLLNGLHEAADDFLAALDGTRDIAALLVHAERLGLPGRQAAELLDMLTRAGFLDDAAYDAVPIPGLDPGELARLAPDLAALALGFLIPGGAVRVLGRRRAAVVAIHGCGRVGASVANILAAAGVGCVVPYDEGPLRLADAAPAGCRSPIRTSDSEALPGAARWADQQTDETSATVADAGEIPRPRGDEKKNVRRDESTAGGADRENASRSNRDESTAGGADRKHTSRSEPFPSQTSREDALRSVLHTTAPSVRTTLPPNRQHPDLAIIAPTSRWPQTVAQDLQAAGVPHLPALVDETVATLGPFVQPGRTSCLRCRDLHRAARDPGWPRVLAQLVAAGQDESPAGSAACDTVLAAHLAVQAAMHALAFIEGDQPPSLNAAFDFTLPYGDRERRDLPPHPDCGCLAERF